MSFFWFVLALVFFVLWLTKKSSGGSGDSYRQGYWDGYRALGSSVRNEIDRATVDHEKIRRLVAIGEGDQPAVQPQQKSAIEPVVAAETTASTGSYVQEQRPFLAPYDTPSAQPAPPVQEKWQPDPTAVAAEKERASLKNLNTVLYMASFLLVAAAAAFVATSMPAEVRLASLIIVTIMFYGVGLVLHGKVERLRPAAVAFVGTGLAILPFVGVALTTLGGMSDTLAWLLTSCVGIVAYGVAAVRLQSQVVSYLTMAFVLSLASSMVATASLPIVWYFVALISVSLIANCISILKPNMLPVVFKQPVEATGQIVTPAALLASLVLADRMTLDMYTVVFGVATAHYLVVWLQVRTWFYETVVRFLAHATLLIVAWDYSEGSVVTFGMWWSVLALLQILYSLVRVEPVEAGSKSREQLWIIGMVGVLVVGLGYWVGSVNAALLTTCSLVAIGLVSAASMVRFRDVSWAYIGLVVSVILPFVVGRWLAEPPLAWIGMIIGFTVLAAAALGAYVYSRRQRSSAVQALFAAAVVAYGLTVSLCGLLAFNFIDSGWAMVLSGALLIAFSYASRESPIEIVGALFTVIGTALWVNETSIASQWQWTAAVLLAVGLLLAGSVVHHVRLEVDRRNGLIGLGLIAFGSLAANVLTMSVVVQQASLVLLAVGVLAALGVRAALMHKSPSLRMMFGAAYFSYALLAWLISFELGEGWAVLVYVVLALVFWVGSYLEKLPPLTVLGNLALFIGVLSLWSWLKFDPAWTVFGVAWVVAGILYGVYWLMVERGDTIRQWICLASVWIILAGAILLQFFDYDIGQRVAAAITVVAGAVTLGVHGLLTNRKSSIEASIYIATFGLQRLVGIAAPEINFVVYAHWWALTIGLSAWWLGPGHRAVRLGVAMGILTVIVGIQALAESGIYSLIFLAEHLVLLVAGALLRKSWAIWWGIAASVLAVLYFLKDYLYLWLAFLGLVLIAIVVWQLSRRSK